MGEIEVASREIAIVSEGKTDKEEEQEEAKDGK